MAIDPGIQTLVLASPERTWQVSSEATKETDRIVAVFREGIKTAPLGSVVSQEIAPSTLHDLSAVAAQSDAVAGKTCTTEIAGPIAVIADVWRGEDLAAKAASAA